MTIGEIIDSIEEIKELEKEIERIRNSPEEYLNPFSKIDELETLIGIYRNRRIESEN